VSTSDMPLDIKDSYDDWSHVQETITMLYLAVCQIENSISESNHSVDKLTSSFTELAEHSREVDNLVLELDSADQLQEFKQKISQTTLEIQQKVNQAITAFQFYDRISQRLDHVASSLEQTSELMQNPDNLNSPNAWQDVQNNVKSSYSMEAERIMFEHIMRGATVKEALEIYKHHFDSQDTLVTDDTDDEIELF